MLQKCNTTEKFMKYNGIFNLVIGSTGLILGLLDIFLLDKSRILIVLYIIMIVAVSVIQKIILKKYRNIWINLTIWKM